MKIEKFNEKKNYTTETGQFILCEYDAGGFVKHTYLFENKDQMNIYIINAVNDFISDITITDEDLEYLGDDIIKDHNNNYIITSSEVAYEWINEYNRDSEPTFSWCKCEKIDNVKLDQRIELAISTKKYNL